MATVLRLTHPLAGLTVRLKPDVGCTSIDGQSFRVEDTWINVSGKSWMQDHGNPACFDFHHRIAGRLQANWPDDGHVLYGKVGSLGYLIHESEIDPDSLPQRSAS